MCRRGITNSLTQLHHSFGQIIEAQGSPSTYHTYRHTKHISYIYIDIYYICIYIYIYIYIYVYIVPMVHD